MRQKFDHGEDPLDPEEQSGGGGRGHPFHHFHGNPFGGGNFGGFKFHFNWLWTQRSLPTAISLLSRLWINRKRYHTWKTDMRLNDRVLYYNSFKSKTGEEWSQIQSKPVRLFLHKGGQFRMILLTIFCLLLLWSANLWKTTSCDRVYVVWSQLQRAISIVLLLSIFVWRRETKLIINRVLK